MNISFLRVHASRWWAEFKYDFTIGPKPILDILVGGLILGGIILTIFGLIKFVKYLLATYGLIDLIIGPTNIILGIVLVLVLWRLGRRFAPPA